MNPDIQTIFLDVGNTLRIVIPDPPLQEWSRRQLATIAGATQPLDEFFAVLEGRWKAYRKASVAGLREASERELWTKHMLPDCPPEQIAPAAGKLTRLWRDRDGRRVARADVRPTVLELHRRGYQLGIIANTITETEIPDWLKEDGLVEYFPTVILSSKVGYRKPGPEIYWEATRQAGVAQAQCAYVGDNPSRDVVGTRKAGFGMVIVLIDPNDPPKEPPAGDTMPDHIIHEFRQLLDIFPAR